MHGTYGRDNLGYHCKKPSISCSNVSVDALLPSAYIYSSHPKGSSHSLLITLRLFCLCSILIMLRKTSRIDLAYFVADPAIIQQQEGS